MGRSPQEGVSTLVVDESFATQDERFVERVRLVASAKYLAGLADRWKRDARPWARQQIFKYLALPMDRPGHHPVVKRLFKQAEANGDNELMAEFLVTFDRLVRRQRRMEYRYDRQTRQVTQEEVLYAPRDQILASAGTMTSQGREGINPFTGEKTSFPPKTITAGVPKNGRLFSYKTRAYVRRRAWRYFRRMGFQTPAAYPQVAAGILAKYRDEDFAKGENILFLDADVVLPDPWFLQMTVAEFEKRAFGAATCKVDPKSDKKIDKVFHEVFNYFMHVTQETMPHAPGFCIFVRKAVHDKVKGFDREIKLAEVPAEVGQLLVAQLLVAEQQHRMLKPGIMDRLQCRRIDIR